MKKTKSNLLFKTLFSILILSLLITFNLYTKNVPVGETKVIPPPIQTETLDSCTLKLYKNDPLDINSDYTLVITATNGIDGRIEDKSLPTSTLNYMDTESYHIPDDIRPKFGITDEEKEDFFGFKTLIHHGFKNIVVDSNVSYIGKLAFASTYTNNIYFMGYTELGLDQNALHVPIESDGYTSPGAFSIGAFTYLYGSEYTNIPGVDDYTLNLYFSTSHEEVDTSTFDKYQKECCKLNGHGTYITENAVERAGLYTLSSKYSSLPQYYDIQKTNLDYGRYTVENPVYTETVTGFKYNKSETGAIFELTQKDIFDLVSFEGTLDENAIKQELSIKDTPVKNNDNKIELITKDKSEIGTYNVSLSMIFECRFLEDKQIVIGAKRDVVIGKGELSPSAEEIEIELSSTDEKIQATMDYPEFFVAAHPDEVAELTYSIKDDPNDPDDQNRLDINNTTGAITPKAVGSVKIKITASETDHFQESTKEIAVKIIKPSLKENVLKAKENLIYNTTDQVLIETPTVTGGTLYFRVDSGDWGTDLPTGLDAGEYLIEWYFVQDNDIYSFTGSEDKPYSLTGKIAPLEYDESDIEIISDLTYNGEKQYPVIKHLGEELVSGEKNCNTIELKEGYNGIYGENIIVVEFKGNYCGTYEAHYTIKPKEITVHCIGQKEFKSTDPLSFIDSDSTEGLIDTDNIENVIKGNFERATGENVDSYSFTSGSIELTDEYKECYSLKFDLEPKFEITPREIVLDNVVFPDLEYDGNIKTIKIVIDSSDDEDVDGTYELLLDSDYSISYSIDPIKPSEYTGTITYLNDNFIGLESVSFIITKRAITITGLKSTDKTYDGKTTATIDYSNYKFERLIDDTKDKAILKKGNANFNNKNVGSNKEITFENFNIEENEYYYLKEQPANITGSILIKDITATISSENKVYDRNTSIKVTGVLNGIISGDNVQLIIPSNIGFVENPNAGNELEVKVSNASLSGTDKDNYRLASPLLSKVNITPKCATISNTGFNPSTFTENGKPFEPKTMLKDGDDELIEGVDYIITYSNNIFSGSALATITFIGNYALTEPFEIGFEIVEKDILHFIGLALLICFVLGFIYWYFIRNERAFVNKVYENGKVDYLIDWVSTATVPTYLGFVITLTIFARDTFCYIVMALSWVAVVTVALLYLRNEIKILFNKAKNNAIEKKVRKLKEKQERENNKKAQDQAKIENEVSTNSNDSLSNDFVVKDIIVNKDYSTLKETLNYAFTIRNSKFVNKEDCAKYLEENDNENLEIIRRGIKTDRAKDENGLRMPLADTYYINNETERKCFCYSFGLLETSVFFIKVDENYANSLRKHHPLVKESGFPRSKTPWYSVIIDESWTKDQIFSMLSDVKAINEGKATDIKDLKKKNDGSKIIKYEDVETVVERTKNSESISVNDALALSLTVKNARFVTKKICGDYLEKNFKDEVEVRRRYLEKEVIHDEKGIIIPPIDTYFVKNDKNQKCFAYVYDTSESMLLILKINESLAKKLLKKHKLIIKSEFPVSKSPWYSIIIDETWTKEKVFELLDDVKELNYSDL